jgi:hypothetical protein
MHVSTNVWAPGLLASLAPSAALACACGCGVFEVGTATMIPSQQGGFVYLEDDYMNQDTNWVGSHSAPAALNTDREIQTNFGGVGFDYQFNRSWGVDIKVPYWDRLFRTDIGTPGQPDVTTYRHSALGDIRISARYTGFSPDMSTGITIGLKLATGDWTYPNFDRDTEIGTGTTDLLLGAYHLGAIGDSYHLQWFVEGLYDRAFDSREGYRPGDELDAAVGVMYAGIPLARGSSLSVLLQLLGSNRLRDSGVNADPPNSGYQRVLLSPGAQVTFGRWQLYSDAEFRLYHYANAAASVEQEGTQGQLVAPVLLKVVLSYQW